MNVRILAALALLASMPASAESAVGRCAAPDQTPTPAIDPCTAPSTQAVMAWSEMLGASNYSLAWETAAPAFRANRDRASWAAQDRALRDALAPVRCHTIAPQRFTESTAGTPPDDRVVTVRVIDRDGGVLEEAYTVRRSTDGSWQVATHLVQRAGRVDPAAACPKLDAMR